MLNDNNHSHREKISTGSEDPDDIARADFTADALAALKALDAHGNDHIELLLQFGKTVSKAKTRLKHGQFNQWCGDVLKKSPSWVSSHRRLYESHEDLKQARTWALDAGHRWANCHSIERLLKLIGEWKKATCGDGATPRAREKRSDTIAELRQRLSEAEQDFIALRDEVPPEVKTQVAELAPLFSKENAAAKEKLAELARQFHWRLLDFVAEICSALQVSPPVPKEAVIAAHFCLPVGPPEVVHLKSRRPH
jgi:hypothetical protein